MVVIVLACRRYTAPHPPRNLFEPASGQSTHSTASKGGSAPQRIELEDGTGAVRFWPTLFSAEKQRQYFHFLSRLDPDAKEDQPVDPGGPKGEIERTARRREDGITAAGRWVQRPIKIFGKEILQPRLTCFYGRKGVTYRCGQEQVLHSGDCACRSLMQHMLKV